MNMISTGAFLPETDASTKQNELVKKLTAAWEKKNSKTARAGGASLMALSLAACGGEDNTPFSAADVSAAEAAATTAALTGADGTVYASVDAAVTSNDTAIADAARAEGVASVDITSDNQAAIDAAVAAVDLTTDNAAATDAAVAADTAFASLADLVAAYDALVSPVTSALTTAASDTVQGSAGNDSFSGTGSTYQTGDVIIDSSSTDNDTLTVALTGANTATPTVTGIENVVFNVTSFVQAEMDADNISASNITINQLQAGASTNADIDNVATNMTVNAGTGITGTFNVDMAAGGSTINTGSAATLTVTDTNAGTSAATVINAGASTRTVNMEDIDSDGTNLTMSKVGTTASPLLVFAEGTTATTDALTITAAGSMTLDTNLDQSGGGQTAQVENLTLAGNGAKLTVALDGSDAIEQVTFSGDQDIEISGAAADFTGEVFVDSSTGTNTVSITTAGVLDIDTSAAIDVLSLDVNMAGNQIDVASGQNITVAVTDGTGLDVNAAAASAATNEISLTVDDGAATASTINFGTVDITNIKTINIALVDSLTSTAGSYGATATVNVSGAGDASIGGTMGTLNAADMTGAATVTLSANLKTATTGAGNDTFTSYDGNFTIDGGAGNNTLDFAASVDMSDDTLSITNVQTLDLDSSAGAAANTVQFASTQLTGSNFIVNSTESATNDVLEINMFGTSFDGSGMTINTDDVTVTFDVTAVATIAHTITGTNGVDSLSNVSTGAITFNGLGGDDSITTGSGADVIDGGAGGDTIDGAGGADTITGGEGADTIDPGTGADTIHLNEGTAAIDTIVFGVDGDSGSTAATMDVVYGFDITKDKLDFLGTAKSNDVTTAVDVSGAEASGGAGKAITATVANGIVSIGGTDAALIDTLVEYVAVLNTAGVVTYTDVGGATEYATVGFELGGSTYVAQYDDGDADGTLAFENMVQLDGVTGITDFGTAAAAATIIIA